MLMTHYREPIDFSVRKLEEAEAILAKWRRCVAGATDGQVEHAARGTGRRPRHGLVFQTAQRHRSSARYAQGSADLIGIDLSELGTDVATFVSRRLALIAEKNWQEADKIRDELLAQGIQLKDGKDPATGERVTTWEVKR